MARKLSLLIVELADAAGNRQTLDYGLMTIMILRNGGRGGVTLDEMLRAVDVLKPVEAAVEAKAGEVVLTDQQWQTLVAKLDDFRFAVADPALAEFGLMIRDAPEIGATGNGAIGAGAAAGSLQGLLPAAAA
jgi:hypothetical protein